MLFRSAKECGDSLAFIHRPSNSTRLQDIEIIKKELKSKVKLKSTDRIYLICDDDTTGKASGRFIIGGRKRNPWEGYASGIGDNAEDKA